MKRLMGSWTKEEQVAYFKFIKENIEIMRAPKLRKRFRIFKRMSDIIKTRGTVQCKSHHQKMMISNQKTLEKLIAYGETFFLNDPPFIVIRPIDKIDFSSCFYRIFNEGSHFKIIINEGSIQTYWVILNVLLNSKQWELLAWLGVANYNDTYDKK